MSEYSIETEAGKIHNHNTREYFKEVFSSYNNGHYRSSVVMLYSITMADLVYKLKELDERDNDAKAKKILDEIAILQNKNPESSDWENKLLDKILASTTLLNNGDIGNLKNLKQHRHLCAHPVLDSEDILFTPNKETVVGHIRNMMEGILQKSPQFTIDIIPSLIELIPGYYNDIGDDERFETFLRQKYFKHFDDRLIKSLFRTLWKFLFKLNNNKTLECREQNNLVINIILSNYNNILLSDVNNDPTYYSNLVLLDYKEDPYQLKYLVDILAIYPEIFYKFTEDAQIIVREKTVVKNELYAKAWFLNGTVDTHILEIKRRMESGSKFPKVSFNTLRNIAEQHKQTGNLPFLLINYLKENGSYIEVATRFRVVTNNLNLFSDEQLTILLSTCNSYYTIYNNNDLMDLLEPIYDLLENRGVEVNLENYTKLPTR
ncbi:hypothetical protein [Paenibacillus wynnii]|uniref:hypothetical protein n=1 Tax=Paenibacillus wynnii TaxID=268407 RepID=UPI00278DD298|nr:hypothetical protein [Paenibacillus wynnii]MDQ0194933.1 hypothetical protein [Paenibacillus wynnii]